MLNFLKVVAAFLLQLVAFIFLYLWLQDTNKGKRIKKILPKLKAFECSSGVRIVSDSHIEKICENSNIVEEKIDQLIEKDRKSIDNLIDQLQGDVENLKCKNKIQEEKIVQLQQIIQSQRDVISQQTTNDQNLQPQDNVLYAKKWKDGMLKECTEDEAQYKLKLLKDRQTADFEYCGEDSFCIANKESVFDGVCIVHNGISAAKFVTNERLGKLQLEENNKWIVKQKAIVKFN